MQRLDLLAPRGGRRARPDRHAAPDLSARDPALIDPATIPPDARLYLRPEGFVDTPVGRDGEVARLAGGLLWFAGYELIAVAGGRRVVQAAVPVIALPGLIANLPEPQAERLRALAAAISAPRAPLALGGRTVRLDQPVVVGVVDAAQPGTAEAGFDMALAGAALVEVDGARGDGKLWEGDEIARIEPVIAALAASGTPSAVVTSKAAVMEAALAAGATLVRDPSGLAHDPRAAAVVAGAGCPVVLGHTTDADGDAVIATCDALDARIATAGIDRARVVIDPGIGTARTLGDALALLNGVALFHGLGCGTMLGGSRERIVGALANEAPADRRLGGSLAIALHGAALGAQLLRAHDVAETVQALKVWRGLRDAALTSRRD